MISVCRRFLGGSTCLLNTTKAFKAFFQLSSREMCIKHDNPLDVVITESDMHQIAKICKKGAASVETVINNVELLRSAGYPFKSISKYTDILLLEESEILKRIDLLSDLKLKEKQNKHLYIAGLSEEEREKQFLDLQKTNHEKALERYKTYLKPNVLLIKNQITPVPSCKEVLSVEDLRKLASIQKLEVFKEKHKFLKSKNFSDQDMYNNVIVFTFSLAAIKSACEELERNHIEDITLNTLYRFLRTKKLEKHQFRKVTLAKMFNWNVADVEISDELRNILSRQGRLIMEVNYRYLKMEGFEDGHLCKLPIVLGHPPKVLSQYWLKIKANEDLLLWDREDKVKTLNLLQYHIEKDRNFTAM